MELYLEFELNDEGRGQVQLITIKYRFILRLQQTSTNKDESRIIIIKILTAIAEL